MERNFFKICVGVFILLHICSGQEADEAEFALPKQQENNTGVDFDPMYNLTEIKSGTYQIAEWTTMLPGAHHEMVILLNNITAEIADYESEFSIIDGTTGRGSVNVSAVFIGYNQLNVTIYDINDNILGYGVKPVSVILAYEKLNKIFTYILAVLIGIVYVNMGATIDLTVVAQIAKKPIGPLVGIICQYAFMPVIAFGLAKLFFPGNPLLQLGMFLNGASPGGGNSNMWTYLLGGSLDLSIMMTFTSTIVAFAAVPLWVLTLGPLVIGDDSEFVIPYGNIAILVVSLIIPCGIGVAIQKISPKFAKFLETRVLAPFSIFNIIFIFTFGVYSHRYIFAMFNWRILLACFALPGLGYLSGLTLATIARRSFKEIIAISIETGVQNANVAILILKFTLEPPPAGDLAVVIPACVFIMTPIPLVGILLCKKLYVAFANSGGQDLHHEKEIEKSKIEMISNGVTELSAKNLNQPEKGYEVSRRFGAGIDNPAAVMHDE